METIWADLRYSARRLRKSPGFTFLTVMLLALGIGANTAIFSVVNAVLLRPLPGVRDPGRLVTLERLQKDEPFENFGYPDYVDYRDQNASFDGLAASAIVPLSVRRENAERIRGALVSGNYFSTLGVRPALGRLIEPADDRAGAALAAVLGYRFWQRAFSGRTGIVGRTIELNGYIFNVIGVAHADFLGTRTGQTADVFLPLAAQPQAIPRMTPGALQRRAIGWINIFGRLKAGVSMQQARAELKTIAARLAQTYPETNDHRSVNLRSGLGLFADDQESLQGFLGLLLAAAGLLLLIACANVANLLLVRATARRREIAVRLAIGATRGRIVRQLMTEGILLSLLAGAAGVLAAPATAALLVSVRQPIYTMTALDLQPDLTLLGFALAVSVLTGVLFGLAPALQASGVDLLTNLKDGAPGAGWRRSRLQGALVTGQVALSFVLLVCAGLTVRTMQKVLADDPGFDEKDLVLLSADLTIQRYTPQQGLNFYEQLLARLGAVPEIRAASLAGTVPPVDLSSRISVFRDGEAPPLDYARGHEFEVGLRVDANVVAPGYFHTMGISFLRGRDFTWRDRADSPPVTIVSERLGRQLWPGGDFAGKHLQCLFGARMVTAEVVGVAADTKYRWLLAGAPLLVYLPLAQNYDGRETLIVRGAGESASALRVARQAVAALDPTLPVSTMKTMSDQIADSLWQQRVAAGLIGSFGLLAMLLAATGIYGAISHMVAQQTREIGICVALGADAGRIWRLVIARGLGLATAGIAIGAAAASAITHPMGTLLYGVGRTDPATFGAVALLLAAAALLACALPARRAMRVDPMVALRCE